MIIHEIELAYNIIRDNLGTKLVSNEEYVKIIKRDFDIDCSIKDIEIIQSPTLSEEIEDMEIQYRNLGLM